MKLKSYHVLIFALLGFFFGFAVNERIRKPLEVVKVVRDTLVHYDTIIHEKPVEIASKEAYRLRTELAVANDVIDSLRALKPDTLEREVYVPVEVPIEEKVYQDSTYRAVVSGYRPRLEYLELYQKEVRITETITRKSPKWSINVTAGPGLFVGLDGVVRPGGGIVVGLGYNIGK